jgi:hypothetical protein
VSSIGTPVGKEEPGQKVGLRFLARFDEAAFDEEEIEALFWIALRGFHCNSDVMCIRLRIKKSRFLVALSTCAKTGACRDLWAALLGMTTPSPSAHIQTERVSASDQSHAGLDLPKNSQKPQVCRRKLFPRRSCAGRPT